MRKSSINDPSIHDVLMAINDFATSVDRRFETSDQRFEKIESALFDIRSTMATKDDIREVKSEIQEVKHETLTAIDGFAVICQKFDVELAALRSRFGRMELFMHKVAARLSMKEEMI